MDNEKFKKEHHNIFATAFTGTLALGIAVCAICDLAISSGFTWSLIPISSIIYTWLSFFPVVSLGRKGIAATLIAASVLVIPFLYVLDGLIGSSASIFHIGWRMAVIAIAYSWIVFVLVKALKARKYLACAVALLLLIPIVLVVNLTLMWMIGEHLLDVWDTMVYIIVIVPAIHLLIMDFNTRKKRRREQDDK